VKAKRTAQQNAEPVERRWGQKLQEQARKWQTAKSDGRYVTDPGVPVIRRHKPSMTQRSAA
jgi:hypothetical protein